MSGIEGNEAVPSGGLWQVTLPQQPHAAVAAALGQVARGAGPSTDTHAPLDRHGRHRHPRRSPCSRPGGPDACPGPLADLQRQHGGPQGGLRHLPALRPLRAWPCQPIHSLSERHARRRPRQCPSFQSFRSVARHRQWSIVLQVCHCAPRPYQPLVHARLPLRPWGIIHFRNGVEGESPHAPCTLGPTPFAQNRSTIFTLIHTTGSPGLCLSRVP